MNKVIISVGSNINPYENIRKAKFLLSSQAKLISESSFIETTPIGITNQPNFVNGVYLIETELDSVQLKKQLIKIENSLERDRSSPKFGPRTIDLDIVVWNKQIMDDDVYERNFLQDAIKEIDDSVCFLKKDKLATD